MTTIGELAGLPSRLIGTATTYAEYLRPTQSNTEPMIRFSAEGTLESGTPFLAARYWSIRRRRSQD